MTKGHVESILRRVEYRDWRFRAGGGGPEPVWLQVVFSTPSSVDGTPAEQHGRKWMISSHAVASEVVKTAWLAVQTAIEHEAREAFTLDGLAIFGPHIDVSALHSIARIHERRPTPAPLG